MSNKNPLRQLVDSVAANVGIKVDQESYDRLDRMAAWDLRRIKKFGQQAPTLTAVKFY